RRTRFGRPVPCRQRACQARREVYAERSSRCPQEAGTLGRRLRQEVQHHGTGENAVIAELGHYALVLALGLALVQAIIPMWGARLRDPSLMAVGMPTAVAQFIFVAIAFGALTACYVSSDFSVLNVAENSHSAMPTIYKYTSVWGNHEGSMLLWVLILTFY